MIDLAAMLEDGRRDFLEAVRGVTPEKAAARVSSKGWTILECIEHMVLVEERYLGWLEQGESVRPRARPDRELRLSMAIRSRLTKVEAPEVFRPAGRFTGLEQALEKFEGVRNRIIRFVREQGEKLYAIGARHPFFGKVNGVEVVRLVDGHSRRHADQIREIRGELASSRGVDVMLSKPKKASAFRRDTPDLPGEFEHVEDQGRLFGGSESVVIQEKQLCDLVRVNSRADGFRIEGSVLERIQLAGGEFGSAVWKDVRLVGCDLANVRAHRLTLVRVELIDCRLTGFSSATVEWRDVLIQAGDVRYAQLEGGEFRNCEFERCNWQDADLRGADLSGCVFRGCDLARADLRAAKLQETDFRQSEVEGMVAGVGDLQGAIVDPAQAMVFARLIGLRIE